MTETPAQALMVLDTFIDAYTEAPFEFIEGEIVPMSPGIMGHNVIAKRLFTLLLEYETRGVGEVFHEAPFVLTDSSEWVRGSRVPDVMFVTAARMAAYRGMTPEWESKPLLLVPDFVAEVVSPNDSYTDITEKVRRYLADGVRLIWILDPKPQTVIVHVADSAPQTYHRNESVTLGEIVPGLAVEVRRLFS